MTTKITLLKNIFLLTLGLAQVPMFGFSISAKESSSVQALVDCPTGKVSDNVLICPGETANVSISDFEGTLQWQQSEDGVSNWTNVTVAGATSASFTTPQLTYSTYYRAVITTQACGEIYSEVVAVSVSGVFMWTGADNTDWNTPDNWSCSMVPTANNIVIIPAYPSNQPIITGAVAQARSLVVDADASLTIATGATLRVANNISINDYATVLVQNNGAIVQDNEYNNSGIITIKKQSNPLYRLDYTMWSSPVQGQAIGAFSPITNPTRFYTYNGEGDNFVTVADLTASFETGKGYLIRMPNTITGGPTGGYYNGTDTLAYQGSFTGTPNTGTITVSLNNLGNRYTAVGNPYPSPISLKEFFIQNQGVLDSISGMYLWRKKNDASVSTYCTLTLAGLVANAATSDTTGEATEGYQYGGQDQAVYYKGDDDNANWTLSQGQGFIVRSKEGITGELTFNNSMRRTATSGGSQSFFRTNEDNTPLASRFWLNLSGNGAFSQTAVAYMQDATLGLDYGYDGARLSQTDNVQLYTTVNQSNLSIQARPAFNITDVVPIGYTISNAGQYTFTLDHMDGVFETTQDIYLKDNLLGVTHNIKEGVYSFTTEAGAFANRFEVVYMNQEALSTANPEFNGNSVIVYQQNGAVNITSGTVAMTDVAVYDVRGSKLYAQNDVNATQTAITNLAAQQQVLIIEITTASGKVSKKIIY